ncbi:hypothetical protein QOZ80_4BG0331840 [Eleusine coracana subsp. coracana]|nr:hypothetical protein QOZ80_4BG0331840 [Eleusine coracana subsp. coracana]
MGESKQVLKLELGFRFHPNDEEVFTYVSRKMEDENYSCVAIGDIDFYRFEPSELPAKAKFSTRGDSNYWFFVRRAETNSKTGTSRVTPRGYWKSSGNDRSVADCSKSPIGKKKTLVYYSGRNPKGTKSDWIMHEYRSSGEWVVCSIFRKQSDKQTTPPGGAGVLQLSAAAVTQFPPLLDSGEAVQCKGAGVSVSDKPKYDAAAFQPSEAAHAAAVFQPSEAAHAAAAFHPSEAVHAGAAFKTSEPAHAAASFKPCEVADAAFEPDKVADAGLLLPEAIEPAHIQSQKLEDFLDAGSHQNIGLCVPPMDYNMISSLVGMDFSDNSFSVPELEDSDSDDDVANSGMMAADCTTDIFSSSETPSSNLQDWVFISKDDSGGW